MRRQNLIFLLVILLHTEISSAIDSDSLNLLWKFSLAQNDEIIVNHSIQQTTCYLASNKAIYAIDLSTGKEIWKYSFTNSYIPSVPSFNKDFCYFILYNTPQNSDHWLS